jgi:hypothetical protein
MKAADHVNHVNDVNEVEQMHYEDKKQYDELGQYA